VRQYGSAVHVGDSAAAASRRAAGTSVVVTAPDDYSSAQLRRLRDAAQLLVLVAPGRQAARAVVPGLELRDGIQADGAPSCSLPGARAAGDIEVPSDAHAYSGGGQSCYGGLLVTAPKVVVLGSADLLHNDHLGVAGAAALDVNLVTADRSIRTVQWLLPGADAGGSGPATLWSLFPAGAHRAFWWLLALAALLVLWQARRFGRVVTEPLPVVVRSAEIVEGHGRLYRRAAARDRAAAALRAGTVHRLARRLALPPGSDPAVVAVAACDVTRAAALWQRSAEQTRRLLADAPVGDEAQLLLLAQDLDRLSDAVRAATGEGRRTT
jgi:hypothetical protein